jgi:formylmethanofuran dehydrogenase subunit E
MARDSEGGRKLRGDIERLVEDGDLQRLLYKAGELHGHLCNYLTYGVISGYIGVHELGVKSTGMEEIVAIVETNNCFSDGVQMVTGCSFGNNALIYKDLGKTAVTVAKRDGEAIRISLDPDYEDSLAEKYPESNELWDRIVVSRENVALEEHERMMKLFAEISIKELSGDTDEMFRVKHMKIKVPEYAPIFASVRCSVCGENVMETKALVKGGKPICKACAGREYHLLDGGGISIDKA